MRSLFFCVYDEPSTDLCLHKNLYLANVHHRTFKRDGVQGIQIEQELPTRFVENVMVTEQTAILLITEGGMGYEREAYPYGSAQGFDPGVTQAYCAYAAKHEFDTIDTIDILDCNGGDHGYAFATNFNPEINLREVSAPGSYWENGHWVVIQ